MSIPVKNLTKKHISNPFTTQYARLNAEQKRAVDTIEGPVMVIAGPGTGKTTILTLRIANILQLTDAPPSAILAITYTDAGVKAMRAKLRDIIGNRAHEVAVHTFHSFASAMIAEYPDHFLHLQGFRQMTGVDQEVLIGKIIAEPKFADLRPIGKPDAYISSILKTIEDAKRQAMGPEEVKAFARKESEQIKNDPDSISSRGATKGKLKADALEAIEKRQRTVLFADVYALYEKEKRSARKMDFSDLIIELLSAFNKDELFLRLIQERFHYLHVDEHQDTNDAQNLILKFIAEFFDTPNVFIVGDEKQAIYRFQGASVENFLDLQNRWRDMKVVKLDTNYRSHQGIIDASFSVIENNYVSGEYADLRVRLKSGQKIASAGAGISTGAGKNVRPLTVATGENVPAMESYLVKQLKAISDANTAAEKMGGKPSTAVIITRRNRDLERVLRLLESNGISVSSERSVDIFHHPVGAIFFDLLEFLADPARLDALGRTVAAGLWEKDFGRSVALIRALRSASGGSNSGGAGSGGAGSSGAGSSGANLASLEKFLPVAARLRTLILEDGAVGFLVHAAELSGFKALVARDPVYVQVWRGIVTLAESLAREGDIQSPVELITALLAYRQSAENKTVKVSVGAPDLPIQAMTAHGSKGLEFDYVFMPYATEEAWVGRARGSSFVLPKKRSDDHDIRDTRRLFYVALTRAKKQVVIMTASEESDGKALSPLRFLAELDAQTSGKNIEQVNLARVGVETILSTVVSSGQEGAYTASGQHGSYAAKMIGLAKEVLLNSGISVTALNHFIECPSTFLYESILKLPQAPAPSAEKGNAMHEAISRIWQATSEKENGVALPPEQIEKIIVDTVTEYLDGSLLSLTDKIAVKKELIENAPIVALALESHFAQANAAGQKGQSSQGNKNSKASAQVSTERWVKASFAGTFEGQQIIMPIHGKIDAIVEPTGANEVLVFDYKTRQAMSPAEIKGETKNSDGGYFRQLVFYRLLLESDPRWRTRKITPALVFVSPDKKDRCPIIGLPITNGDVDAIKKRLQEVIDSVWSGRIMDDVFVAEYCKEQDCQYCALRRMMS